MRKKRLIRIAAWAIAAVFISAAALATGLSLAPKPVLLEDVPFGKIVLDAKGDILKIGLSADSKYRLRTDLENIAPEAIRALIQYEDRYFYIHPGINPLSIARSFISMAANSRKLGASTITMQVARMRYGLKTSSISGKLRQIWHAMVIERHYSKDEILEAWFNLAPYGGNIEGIEAAARIYFRKSANMLTVLESHALAVVPQNPVSRNPLNGKDFNAARLRLEQTITDAASSNAVTPLKVCNPATLPFAAPHLSLELLARSTQKLGIIRTGIERDLQDMLERSLSSFTARGKRYAVNNASAILVDCDNMQVVALAGSADFNNCKIRGQVDGTRARRSPGSTLKPFIYALALDQGLIHPMTMLPDSPRSFGGYDPENFDRGFRGPLPAHEALKASRNLPAITLAGQLRKPGLYGFLRNANVELDFSEEHYGLALALGGAEVSMRELAALYAMLANKGLWKPLRIVKDDIAVPARRMLSPEAARLVLWMLENPDVNVASRGGNVPVRCKTGTSNGLRDAWTAGIVGKYALVVWVGNFDNSSSPFFVGAKTALPLFMEICRNLGQIRQLRDKQSDLDNEANIASANVCVATGDFDNGHCQQTAMTYYIPGVSPVKDSGVLRPVLIDKASGLRACAARAGETEEIWMEFWPSDMARIFARAGINKPQPPAWLPQCQKEATSNGAIHARAPRIVLPKKHVTYHRKISDTTFNVPLLADSDAEAGTIHWYAGKEYLGSAKAGEVFFWKQPKPGKNIILAVDDLGGSARQICDVQTVP